LKISQTQAPISLGLWQAEGDVFGGSHALWESFTKKITVLDQLGKQMGNLQQI